MYDHFNIGDSKYYYLSLAKLDQQYPEAQVTKMPYVKKIFLENVLRHHDGINITDEDLRNIIDHKLGSETQITPVRVLNQDFTGVPAVVDLAAMRDEAHQQGWDVEKINPQCRVDLVVDHSLQVVESGSPQAVTTNVDIEMLRNRERYVLLKWAQNTFENYQVVPPGVGICHQVNIEYLATVVDKKKHEDGYLAYPDSLVGTDSHTTMVNGLGVLGWGVGGIEAEACMLGQPLSVMVPKVLGVRLQGRLKEGATATDLVLTLTETFRKRGVVGWFIEFFGEGLDDLMVAERATLSNMCPEFGATAAVFPIDDETLRYLALTGRSDESRALVEQYAKVQHLWHKWDQVDESMYDDVISFDLSQVEPCVAGPRRPQDKVLLNHFAQVAQQLIKKEKGTVAIPEVNDDQREIQHGDLLIAAITSCTNTSNPDLMIAAGLVAKRAVELGLKVKPWVKTSFAPGSQVVTDYLEKLGLMPYLEALGFHLVGYGCTTCIGNSGPLPEAIVERVEQQNLWSCAILSGNRNFEGRIHPHVVANWLASPPLVVAYALLGTTVVDITTESLGRGKDRDIFLADLWPSSQEISAAREQIDSEMFKTRYAQASVGNAQWAQIPTVSEPRYDWNPQSTYIRQPSFFEKQHQGGCTDARMLLLLGDSITTDHISPAGAIPEDSPAGIYLQSHGVAVEDFNSYGARRGNHELMVRGTFANIRIRNLMLNDRLGGYTQHFPSGEVMSVYDAAMRYQGENTPLVVIGGKEYGTGSSRDWAAKGTRLLGVKVVLAESFERIHRSNLVGMGVLPCLFTEGVNAQTLGLTGRETVTVIGFDNITEVNQVLECRISDGDKTHTINIQACLSTYPELQYYHHGGILNYVMSRIYQEAD